MVAELFLSAFLQVLFDRLASRELLNFARQEGVDSKIEKLENTLQMIQAVLNDAEEKQLTNGAVKLWLDNLKHLAYDMEDLLDEFATEALKRKLEAEHQSSTSRVRSLIPAAKFNFSVKSKIKDITSRLEDLCKHGSDLSLQNIAGGSSTAPLQRPPATTYLPTEPAVCGRDGDKAKILEMMSTGQSGEAKFLIISIVGMGGLGKTTLARFVYNDEAIEDFHFQEKAWVCVSDDFEAVSISKKILQSFTNSSCNLMQLNEVQHQLKDVIANKRFLLVLDDLWIKNYGLWETLKSPFMFGAAGSKIIATTRDKSVADSMASDYIHELKLLSDEDCWSVFKKHAFRRRDDGASQNLKQIHKKVVEKCNGLPLAARTLGGLLQSKKTNKEWDDILNSKIWDIPVENDIAPIFKLSYHYLPAHLKRCFAYCAIFPKDYEFEEEELVFLWMAEGLIRESERKKQFEDIGNDYFRDLLSRSFFQQSSIDNSKYIMHDLIHDLAQWASGESSFRLEEGMETNQQLRRFQRVRHFSYTSSFCDGKNRFDVFHRLENLRTFLPIILNDGHHVHYITKMMLSSLLSKFKNLMVLSLSRYHITELPESINVLKHLRYLNLSHTKIKSLPESASSLLNLQSLLLRNCYFLRFLPYDMSRLINLRHFDIRGVYVPKMPLGMKEMKCLHTLSNFIVGKDTGSSLKDLKDLKFLHGELCISSLENVVDLRGLREAILSDKKDLKVLSLAWSYDDYNSQNEAKDENVLDRLRPHENIEDLTIENYSGKRFPSWLGDSTFCNMVVLKLKNCKRCTSLPSLGQLKSLEDVTISEMKEIKVIDSEIFGESCSKPFLFLKTLCFEDMQEWERWDPIKESEDVKIFPQLRKLSIVKCPKLTGRITNSLPSLEELVVRECAQLMVSSFSLLMHKSVEIKACKEMFCNIPSDSKSLNSMTPAEKLEFGNCLKQGDQKLEHLRIDDFEKLVYLWQNKISIQNKPQELHICSSLKILCIQNCPTLVSFPEIGFFPPLCELEIKNCNSLIFIVEGMKHDNKYLKKLEIADCPSLTFILKGKLPSSLETLSVFDCEKLQLLFDDGENTCSSWMQKEIISNTSPLKKLKIINCPSLTCLSSRGELSAKLESLYISNCPNLLTLSSTGQLPVVLTELHIWNCSKLEAIAERFHKNSFLQSIWINGCENLKSLPEGLYNLNGLDSIYLENCPNLVCCPEGGLPNTILNFKIGRCEKVRDLPTDIHSIKSLQHLSIEDCPYIRSFPAKGFPTNLTSLSVGNNLEIYKALKEWGLYKFTSLTKLTISGCPDAVSFPEDEMGMVLPTSLKSLCISDFPKLKCLSSKGFRDLTSLEELRIKNCPNLSCFPKEGLPSSLLQLQINECPLLMKQRKTEKVREWSKIVDIPCVYVNKKFFCYSDHWCGTCTLYFENQDDWPGRTSIMLATGSTQ